MILDEAGVRQRIDPDALITAMESALVAFSSGDVTQPVRTVLDISGRGFFAAMPADARSGNLLGAKLVSIFPGNADRGLPTHLAVIVLVSRETGETLAVMDGRYITEVRTAAVTAVSVRHLARADAQTLGILGSGVQARSHVEMLRRVRPWSSIAAWSPDRGRLHGFAAEAGVQAAESAEAVARECDVLVTVTNAPRPVVRSDWLRPGTHVAAVGACRPQHAELDPALVARSRLFVDSRAAALEEAGDVLWGIDAGLYGPEHIAAELGEVVAGKAIGRTSPEEITVFKSLGLAVEDLFAAGLVYGSFSR